MPLATNIIVVGEDDAHVNFARGFFSVYAYPNARVLDRKPFPGKGDAKEFVRQATLREIDLIERQPHNSVKLVVLIDSDNFSVSERRKWLFETVTAPDYLTIVIPNPEIEFWITTIVGANEPVTIRKKDEAGRRAYKGGKELARACKEGKEAPEPMREFCTDVRRLTEFLMK